MSVPCPACSYGNVTRDFPTQAAYEAHIAAFHPKPSAFQTVADLFEGERIGWGCTVGGSFLANFAVQLVIVTTPPPDANWTAGFLYFYVFISVNTVRELFFGTGGFNPWRRALFDEGASFRVWYPRVLVALMASAFVSWFCVAWIVPESSNSGPQFEYAGLVVVTFMGCVMGFAGYYFACLGVLLACGIIACPFLPFICLWEAIFPEAAKKMFQKIQKKKVEEVLETANGVSVGKIV